MRNERLFLPIVATIGALALSACGGGGGGGGGVARAPSAGSARAVATIAPGDAARLAKQASFGPTQTLVDHIQADGSAAAWIDEQFAATGSSYGDLAARVVTTDYCNALTGAASSACRRDYFSSTPVAMAFYAHAIGGGDHLRQRVAFALSQLIVASDVEVHSTAGLATFDQILLDGAFGNYRDLLQAVTLNPCMGAYLNLVGSSKSAPNENYAREFMQLFSMGVGKLHADGSPVLDATGAPIPNYTAADVHAIARALTGWTYARTVGASATDGSHLDFSKPMVALRANYDTTAKSFLGVTVPANATQAASMAAVVDAVFANPTVGPHVGRFLIQQLVTSNPTPAYVARISGVFDNDGAGVRGDLAAVVRAVLLDPEARGTIKNAPADGKFKEPVLLLTSLGRLIGDATDGYAFSARDAAMGEQPFRAPSVFNFYPPDYPLPLGGGLVSPAGKLLTTASAIARHNLVYDWTIGGDAAHRPEYAVVAGLPGATGTTPGWAAWTTLAANVPALLDAIDLLMLNDTMTAEQRRALQNAVLAVTDPDPATQARKRAQAALYVVGTSPQFQTDR